MRIALTLAAALAALPALASAAEGAPAQSGQPSQGMPPGHPPMATPPKPMTPAEVDKALYGVGLAVSKSLEVFDLTPAEMETVLRGIRDSAAGKPKAQLDAKLQQQINDLARTRAPKAAEKAAAKEKEAGAAYLAKVSKEKGARKTPAGAIVIVQTEGTGPTPTASDKVKVNYKGTLTSGRVFDASEQHGGPAEFPLGSVIKCWTDAFPTLKVGTKAKIVCPSDIAYGPNGAPPLIPGNAVLTFEVELLQIVK
jgi:FKBP-type peptidyl-prolyl cis-trans isomerase